MFPLLDPDGSGVGVAPVEVYCDMKTGTTRIDHELADQVQTQQKIRLQMTR